MSFAVRRAAVQAARTQRATPATRQFRRTYAEEAAEKSNVLQQGAKKDPELYTLMAIMIGAAGLVGWHFSRNPTSSSSENKVAAIPGSEPWGAQGGEGKYQYHPGGDTSRQKRDAPSALNEVVVPNVSLPKELHEQYNKWGKEL